MRIKELIERLLKLDPNGIIYITDPASLYFKQINKDTKEFQSGELMSYGKEEDL